MQIKIANLFHLPFFLFPPLLSFVSPLLAVNVFTVPNTLGPQSADSATALAGAFLLRCKLRLQCCSATEPTGNSALYILCSYRPCRIKQQSKCYSPHRFRFIKRKTEEPRTRQGTCGYMLFVRPCLCLYLFLPVSQLSVSPHPQPTRSTDTKASSGATKLIVPDPDAWHGMACTAHVLCAKTGTTQMRRIE